MTGKKQKPSVFVCDADDTLWMNEWQYSQSFAMFFNYLYEIFGSRAPNYDSLTERFKQVDHSKFENYGIRRGRVAASMVEIYSELCDYVRQKYHQVVRSPEEEAQIRKIGDMPFDYTKLEWLESARITLEALKGQGHKLCLLTCYDRTVFPKKSEFLNLKEFFGENILAIEVKKTEEDFKKVSGWNLEIENEFENWYAVGNGYESDIEQALRISNRWSGLLIPHGSTSKYFKAETKNSVRFIPPPINNPRVIELKNIKEILDHI